jgi:hypothetical protein
MSTKRWVTISTERDIFPIVPTTVLHTVFGPPPSRFESCVLPKSQHDVLAFAHSCFHTWNRLLTANVPLPQRVTAPRKVRPAFGAGENR